MFSNIKVEGMIPVDEKSKKMMHIYKECVSLGIEPPQEIFDFLGDKLSTTDPFDIDMIVHSDVIKKAYEACSYNHVPRFIINLDKLPQGVKRLRVSYVPYIKE